MVNVLYTVFVGVPLALLLWGLALACAATIIGIPLAGVLATFAVKVLTLKRRPTVIVR